MLFPLADAFVRSYIGFCRRWSRMKFIFESIGCGFEAKLTKWASFENMLELPILGKRKRATTVLDSGPD